MSLVALAALLALYLFIDPVSEAAWRAGRRLGRIPATQGCRSDRGDASCFLRRLEATVTFKQFMAWQAVGQDARDDFLWLAKADPDLPIIRSWGELSEYLERRHGFDAVVAGRAVWEAYERTRSEAERAAHWA
jgi:hypothetical protein